MRYRKAPILEAVMAFRWSSPKSLDELEAVLSLPAFAHFEKSKPRIHLDASFDFNADEISHEKRQLGYEAALRDGSEIVFLEEHQFVFVQRAPYDRWEYFCEQVCALLDVVVDALKVDEFERVGLRFVNRIDVPVSSGEAINTDDYVTVNFNGPREDRGIIEEFQMRVVKPTEKDGVHYALVLATTKAPMPGFASILLDIDVFTKIAIPARGEKLTKLLAEMRHEKNNIFEECLTDRARDLFGGVEE